MLERVEPDLDGPRACRFCVSSSPWLPRAASKRTTSPGERQGRPLGVRAQDRREGASTRAAARVTNPTNGGRARVGAGDVRIITTVDEHPGGVLTDDWGVVASSRRPSAVCAHCGAAVEEGESDPALMLGVVLLLVANTLVIAALVAAVVWIVA